MYEQGLIDEIKTLMDSCVTEEMQSMQGIGYKEVAEGLRIGSSESEVKELIKKNTRNYAKRQQTFFKRMENHVYLSPEEDKLSTIATLLKN